MIAAGGQTSRTRKGLALHHSRAATVDDPDFHPDPGAGPLRWYMRFMAGYLGRRQMVMLLSAWSLLAVLSASIGAGGWPNVLLFCTLPLLLSSGHLSMRWGAAERARRRSRRVFSR